MNSIYSTAFHIVGSFNDMQIEFARIEPIIEDNGNVVGHERVVQQRVTLPLSLAKDLAQKLNQMIAGYEESFGDIRMPPQAENE